MDDILGIPWRKLIEFILSMVIFIVGIIEKKAISSETVELISLVIFIYLAIIVILCIARKSDLISGIAVVATDIALGYALLINTMPNFVGNFKKIASLILAMIMILFAYF